MEDLRTLGDKAKMLNDAREEIRYMAVKDLGRMNSFGALPLLMDAISDTSYRVREEALNSLCSFPPEDLFPRLEEFVRDNDNANLRNAAMDTFVRYGRESAPYLCKLLKDSDEEMRNFAAVMLGNIKDPASMEALVDALSDRDENVVHAAAESLGRLGDPRAVDPLMKSLEGEFWIKYPAIVALGEIGDPRAAPRLLSFLDDEMLCEPTVEALGKIGDIDCLPSLASVLARNESTMRNAAVAALVRIQSRIEKHIVPDGNCAPSIRKALEDTNLLGDLLRSLDEGDIEVKKNSVIALGWLKKSEAAPKLISLLGDYELEEYAVGALSSIGSAALPRLIESMEGAEPDKLVALIRCIGWIESPDGAKACLKYTTHYDPAVRSQAVSAIMQSPDPGEFADNLLDVAGDADPEVRTVVAEALGRIKSDSIASKLADALSGDPSRAVTILKALAKQRDEGVVRRVRSLLASERDDVRGEAYATLTAMLGVTEAIDALAAGSMDDSPYVRRIVARCMGSGPALDVEKHLVRLLEDQDAEVRSAAVEALGKVGSPSSLQGLLDAYGSADKSLKMKIVKTMEGLCDKSCTQFLISQINDTDADLRRVAIESIAKIGDSRAAPSIAIALDDPDWSVRAAAVNAIGKMGDRKAVSLVVERLDDPEDIVKKCALDAVVALGSASCVNDILPLVLNENLHLHAIEAVEKLGVPDMKRFFDFFRRCNTRLKCSLVELIGRLRDRDAVPYLMEILSDEFFTVRALAAKALGEIGDPAAIHGLLRAQKEDPSEEVKRESATALKKIG